MESADPMKTGDSTYGGPEEEDEESKLEKNILRLEKQAADIKSRKIQENVERINYNKFPTILGWYFDGTFTTNFNLNEEYTDFFTELEQELEAKQDFEIEETFTEKAYRNFWPPKFFGHFFRTRGVYLDMKETKEDPPKQPPEINFEQPHAIFGTALSETEVEADEGRIRFGKVEFASASGRRGMDKRDNFFWNDDTREFLPKEKEEEYDWYEEENVWKMSNFVNRNPYSWYWHQLEGKYFIRDKSRRDDYIFDQQLNIFKKKDLTGISHNRLGPHDYFYCEVTHKWIANTVAVNGETEYYINGKREIKKGTRGATGLGPDDFYYSAVSGKMERKVENLVYEYYYDTNDEMFKMHGEAYGPGKTGLYPVDYKFSNTAGEWLPKNPRELYKPSPYDWYFDLEKGRFYPIDKTQKNDYEFDQNTNVWEMKGVVGPSVNGLAPEDYVYDETNRAWKLQNTFLPEEVQIYEPGKRKIRKGIRGKTDKIADDFFYDSIVGEFERKESGKLSKYYYDTQDEIFRKIGQPYGPGKSKLYPSQYYFDDFEGDWLPTSEAKSMNARMNDATKLKAPEFQSPYDFAFDDYNGKFIAREVNRIHDYKYDQERGVFVFKNSKGPSVNGKTVRDYFFDEHEHKWLPLENFKGHEARDYKNGRRNNRSGPRGKSGKTTDDFYFWDGKFLEKDRFKPDIYCYHEESGVWKLKEPPVNESTSTVTPNDYYFSYEDGLFILKKDLKHGEIGLDKNTHLWIQKLRSPPDFLWDGRNYSLRVAKPFHVKVEIKKEDKVEMSEMSEKSKPVGKDDKLGKNELKDYNKPWLESNPYLAADKQRFINQIEKGKQTKADKDPKSTNQEEAVGKKRKTKISKGGAKTKNISKPD